MTTIFLLHYADITYRTLGDTRDAKDCPVLGLPACKTEEELDREIERTCHNLMHQPTEPSYEILAVRRGTTCGRCQGSEKIRVRPKGWRKRSAPPWFLCREVSCPDCQRPQTKHQP